MTRIGVLLPPDLPTTEVIPFIGEAEAFGFHELWVAEDCFLRGGIAQAAVALAITERITIGMGILPAGARNAAFAAMDIATLEALYPGRLIVGVGHGLPGWMRQVGSWQRSPVTLLAEYVEVLRALLAGKEVDTSENQYVHLDGVRLRYPPISPPPVYIGARGPVSLAIAADVADGTVLAEPVTPGYLAAVREAQPTRPKGHHIVAYNVAAVDEDRAVALDLARRGLEWIGEPDWAPHIACLPLADEFRELRARHSSRAEFARALPDEWVMQLTVSGTIADARSRIDALSDSGVDHVVLIPAGGRAGLPSLASLI